MEHYRNILFEQTTAAEWSVSSKPMEVKVTVTPKSPWGAMEAKTVTVTVPAW